MEKKKSGADGAGKNGSTTGKAAASAKASAKASGAGKGAKTASKAARAGRTLRKNWYDEQNREIVVYYLIAVAFLELIVGAVAFFYGVVHAVPIEPGGPRMAQFPWVGWLVAAVLSPVGLLLLLHLSGQFFSRSLNAGEPAEGGTGSGASDADVVPERVQRVYTIVKHAPTVVILLGLIGLGCAFIFLDSAVDVLRDLGSSLKPYIPWILGSIVAFLVICYLGRLWFMARHRRMEQEFAYRMHVFEKTGVIIASKGCIPMRVQDGKLQMLDAGQNVAGTALPAGEEAAAAASAAAGQAEDVMDVVPEAADAPKAAAGTPSAADAAAGEVVEEAVVAEEAEAQPGSAPDEASGAAQEPRAAAPEAAASSGSAGAGAPKPQAN